MTYWMRLGYLSSFIIERNKMTKYKSHESRLDKLRQQKADLPIAVSSEEFEGEEDNDNIEYICKHCRRSLIKIHEEGEYYCNHCSISVFPEVDKDVRSKHKLVTPIGMNLEPCLSYPPDPNKEFFSDKQTEIKGGLKALQDKGVRITSYHETGSDGKLRRRRITWD
jgi:DNA-directed RNA polymerase subunit RPC12/RpoP